MGSLPLSNLGSPLGKQNGLKWDFLKIFFLYRTFSKFLLNLLQYCFCFMFWGVFFGHKACGILDPQPGMEPPSPALEGEVLTTGPPGKSLK